MDKSRDKEDQLKTLSLKIAEDLSLKLLERRTTSAGKVPGLLNLIGKKCFDLVRDEEPQGIPFLRLASQFTGRLIERGSLSDPEQICHSLEDYIKILREVSSELPERHRKVILNTSVNLALKMLETKTLSPGNLSLTLKSLAVSASTVFDSC
ncbi:MAG: hypothetical protein LBE27_07420 [Deltaproteobacteria bacterium]|jgi:hypothetical protein|nr:hypothetical protein [Deltaproteobacteria bacterium]